MGQRAIKTKVNSRGATTKIPCGFEPSQVTLSYVEEARLFSLHISSANLKHFEEEVVHFSLNQLTLFPSKCRLTNDIFQHMKYVNDYRLERYWLEEDETEYSYNCHEGGRFRRT